MNDQKKYYNDNQLAFCQRMFEGGRPNAVNLTSQPVPACETVINTTQVLEHLE